jgi:hypothetical protein
VNPEDLARSRFKPVAKALEKISRLGTELTETRAQVEQLERERAAAAHRDRQAYADALSEGRARPVKREEAKVIAQLEDAGMKAEALALAVDAAHDERTKLLEQNHPLWRLKAMRTLASAKTRYADAIAEIEAARDSLSDEAALVGWLDGGAGIAAATDSLGGRIGALPGEGQPLSFALVLDELRRDLEHLVAHPVSRDDPQPRPRPELIPGVIRTGLEWGGE